MLRTTAAVTVAVIALLSACGDESPAATSPPGSTTPPDTGPVATREPDPAPGPGITVSEALETPPGRVIAVDGFLVAAENQAVMLSEALAESYPPQPGGAVLVVEGVDPASIAGAITAMGVTWTDGEIQLVGRVADGVLTVEPGGAG
jgi:hypothetical protein